MTTATTTRNETAVVRDRMCAILSQAEREDPCGSATMWTRLMVIETPLPWDREITLSKHFPAGVEDILKDVEELRLQAVQPDPDYSKPGFTRVMLFTRPATPFRVTPQRVEYLVPSSETFPLVQAIFERRDELRRFDRYVQDTSDMRDLLVCTHGTRDVCCASIGYPLYEALRKHPTAAPGGKLRVWRQSHTGGHRYASNTIDLPEGRYWSRLGVEHAETLATRSGNQLKDLRSYYRGWAALTGPVEQIAEREAFIREGWSWRDRQVSMRRLSESADGAVTRLRVNFADLDGNNTGAYEVTVKRAKSVPTYECLTGAVTGEVPQHTTSNVMKVQQLPG